MSRPAAFFDVDGTVIEVNSASEWITYERKTGRMDSWTMIRAIGWVVRYRLGLLNFEAMASKALGRYAGAPIDEVEEEVAAWFRREIAKAICVEAVDRIDAHRAQGHVLALLTSGTSFLAHPVGGALDIEHILCTELEIVGGRLTGRHVAPACYGAGKVVHAERFAEEQGVDLDASYFYTDSISDLPMLERVGHPRIVNPDPRLRRLAARRGWAVERWSAA